MQDTSQPTTRRTARRAFVKAGALAAGGAALSALGGIGGKPAFADDGTLSHGDAAVLRFLAAAELIETDLWLQYAELGGTQDSELPGLPTGGSAAYTAALNNLDADMAQYIHDNTEDELTHELFINAFLLARGASPVNLDAFRTLPSSKATGANQIGRLTNLMHLTVDTSWWTRYRSRTHNPDLDPDFVFPPAVKSLANGQFPAIPRTDADLSPAGHIQAIANTAAFHFATIEQGGTSLYPTLALRVTDLTALRVVLSIGPTEACHFQTWHDKAGNAVSAPLAPLTDPSNSALTFPNLNALRRQDFRTNLIMPEPCPFLNRALPAVSIIRPTSLDKGGAMAAVKALTASGLFIGQSNAFFQFVTHLAQEADKAQRGGP
jgi:hypothetical protein